MSVLTLEERVQALEDRNAVIELAATYNRGVDSYDEALWMTVWHEDAEYQIGDTAHMLADADVTATDRSGRALMLAASYVDTCERRNGRWGFTRREITLHYATPVTKPWTLKPDERFVLDA